MPPELPADLLEAFLVARFRSVDPAAAVEDLCKQHPQHATAIRLHAARPSDAESLRPAPAPGAWDAADGPERVGPFQVLELLGHGGFGEVFLAEQRVPIHRRVALKLLKLGMDSKSILARFHQEREVLAAMNHDAIAKVLDAGVADDGRPYFVMEYVEGGRPITDYCDEQRLSIEERLRLFQHVCHGVHHSHQKGILHRDIKPANILARKGGHGHVVKIIDFGIAKAMGKRLVDETIYTEQRLMMGTPEYMAPEQAAGLPVLDTRADVYSLGVVLCQILTGQVPFPMARLRMAGESEVLRILCEEEPRKPSTLMTDASATAGMSGDATMEQLARLRRLPSTAAWSKALSGDLDWIILKALAKEPDRRYSSAVELADDLRRHSEHEPVHARRPSTGYLLRKFLRKHRGAAVATACVALALAAGAMATFAQYREATVLAEQKARKVREFDQLADAVHLRRFTEDARGLVEGSIGVAALEDWVAKVEVWLEKMDDHAASLEALRVRGRLEGGACRFEDASEQFLHDALADLVKGLVQFRSAIGPLALAKASLEWSRRVGKVTVEDERGAWRDAAAAVAADPRFGGLQIAPQEGLVPIGADPRSGLQEFWMPRAGARPTRIGDRMVMAESTGIVLVLLPGGDSLVGSPPMNPAGRHNQRHEVFGRTVRLSPFFIGKHELTQGQWMRLAGGHNPSRYPTNQALPVEQVSWNEATMALRRHGLQLPTEAQWEHACRAGTTTEWWYGDRGEDDGKQCLLDPDGRCRFNAADGYVSRPESIALAESEVWPDLDDGYETTAPVDEFEPNAFGLYTVHGNVAEMTRGSFGHYESKLFAPADGEFQGDSAGEYAVRGGSFTNSVEGARSASRRSLRRDSRAHNIGIRVTRAISR